MRVKNYRSIKDATLTLGNLTALVGRNGAGKSNFLNALELFFDQSRKPDGDDFFNRDVSQPIEVEVTFAELDDAQRRRYGVYVNNGALTVARVLVFGDKQARYYGSVLQHPKFAEIRQSTGNQTEKRGKFNELVKSGEMPGLTGSATRWQQAEDLMNEWESSHADCLERIRKSIDQKETQFFGFAGGSLIGQDVNIVRVPAVREAQDDADDKGQSPVSQLMEAVVRRTLAERLDYREFVERTKSEADGLMGTLEGEVLNTLRGEFNTNMQMYAPGSTVRFELVTDEFLDLKPIRADVSLEEDGFVTEVGNSGHGVQRAFIFAALQQLSLTRRASDGAGESEGNESGFLDGSKSVPTTILAIDEPELYQHPSRQRHIASTFQKLVSANPGGPLGRVQVVFTTHSPNFVSLHRCDDVRLTKKVTSPDRPVMSTEIRSADVGNVAKRLEEAHCSPIPFTAESLRPRLIAVTNPWVNEGFFPRVVVLVEGETDRSAIRATALSMDCDFDRLDVAVIPCDGKPSLDRPLAVFRELEIPCFLVWDGDKGKGSGEAKMNKSLMRLVDMEAEEFPCFVNSVAACFSNKLESTLRAEWGADVYQRAFDKACGELGLQASSKNQWVYEKAIENAQAEGASSKTLEEIVSAIVKLRGED